MGRGHGMSSSVEVNLTTITATSVTATDIYATDGIVVGHTAQITTGAANELQVLGTGAADSRMTIARFSADAVGPDIDFVKSRAAAITTNTIVQDNDVLGRLCWYPGDGAGNFDTLAATFQAEVDDGSPAATEMGVAFVWSQMPGGGGAIAETMRLSAAGDLSIANGGGLIVGAAAQVTTDAANEFQVLGTAAADSSMTLGQWSAAATGPSIDFVKSRNATIGSSTIVQDNDVLGGLYWHADDGTDFVNVAASFHVEVDDASPAANDVGAAFVWRAQAGGGAAIADMMRLSINGLALGSTGAAYLFGNATIMEFGAQGGTRAVLSVSALYPGANDGQALGTTANMWSDLYLADGGVINWNNGNTTLTQSSAALTLGASMRFILGGRLLEAQGADVASANDLTLGADGNVFEITGATQVNAITTATWQNGSMVTLLFTSTPTVKHNTAGGAGTAVCLLAGAADFVASAGDTLTLVLSEIGGTQAWREVARTVI